MRQIFKTQIPGRDFISLQFYARMDFNIQNQNTNWRNNYFISKVPCHRIHENKQIYVRIALFELFYFLISGIRSINMIQRKGGRGG